jgi:hypothetical protein
MLCCLFNVKTIKNKKDLKVTIDQKKQIVRLGTSKVELRAQVENTDRNNVSFKWYKRNPIKNQDELLIGIIQLFWI